MLFASGAGEAGHTNTLLIELGAIQFALGALGRLARAVQVPVIPLYLLAGLCFGQGGFLSMSASNDFLTVSAEIGVILLLVMLGPEWPILPLALLLVVVLTSATKIGTGYVAARRDAVKSRGRWRAGVTLIPRGEFSVVIATLAVSAGVEPKLGPLTACYVLLTIVLGAAVQQLPDRLSARSSRMHARSPVR